MAVKTDTTPAAAGDSIPVLTSNDLMRCVESHLNDLEAAILMLDYLVSAMVLDPRESIDVAIIKKQRALGPDNHLVFLHKSETCALAGAAELVRSRLSELSKSFLNDLWGAWQQAQILPREA